MCVNYTPSTRQQIAENFGVDIPHGEWKPEVWQDYAAPIIIANDGERQGLVASYGLIPKDKMPPGVRLTTMNARAETVGSRISYRKPWAAGQLCLAPLQAFYEPCYETGKAVRWRIHVADEQPFAVAGIWQKWTTDEGELRYTFSQLTINADDHPFMKRFHKPGDEKRSLVLIPPEEYGAWLNCRDPELARSFLLPVPDGMLEGGPRSIPLRQTKK